MAVGTTVARINTIVTANTSQFTAGMKLAEGRAAKFKASIGNVAKAASGPLTLGLLGAGAAAVKAATEFDDSMSKIESLVGVAGSEVEAMKDSVLGLAGETARAPAELADAMFFIQSAGLRGSVAMDTLEASAKAAAVGLGDTATIADLATSALNAYGAENLSATDATDVLTAAVREGKLEASELSAAMGQTLPVASAMGVRFDEVGAAFAAMSRTGTGASEAATQLRGILSTMLRPSKQAEEALEDMGMSSKGLREQIKDEGLLSTLQTLVGAFDGNAAATATVFGNVRALTGVLDLMGSGAETTEAIFASMEDTTGTLAAAFEVASETAGFKFNQAMADMQTMLVEIGQQVLPIVLTMLEGVQTMVEAFSSLPGPLKLAAAAMAAFVIASGPIGQIALAVGGLLYVVGKMGEESKKAAKRQEGLTNEFKAADDPASTMIDRMKEMADAIEDVGDESDGLASRFDTLIGSQTAMSMAMDNEVLGAFDRLELSMDDVAIAAKGGTDLFQDMQNTYQNFGPDVEQLRKHLVGLEGAEADVAASLIDAMEAGTITSNEFLKMIDVVDETADAFDDNRAALQKNAEEFVKSADAVKLLNNSNVDGVKLLAEWEEAGIGYVQQAKMISAITLDLTDQVDNFSIEAQRAGIETRILADEMDEAAPIADGLETSMSLVERVMATSAETAASLAESFEKLMSSVIFEGEALNNTKNLMAEFDDILAEMAENAVPDLEGALYDMATQAAAQIGELHDAGIELGSPEMTSAAEAFIADIDAIGAAAQLPNDELAQIKRTLMEMSGMVVPITLRMQTEKLPGFVPEAFTGTGVVGATGGIVTRPTVSLIGEAGPEAVVPLSSTPGSSPLPGGLGGGTVNVTVTMPPGSDGADVVRALQSYARSHGGTVPILTGQL